MPVTVPHLQKAFKVKLHNGEPEARISAAPDGMVMPCCPLCGCSHHILSSQIGQSYSPLCQSIPQLFKKEAEGWRKQHPEVVSCTTVHLVTV